MPTGYTTFEEEARRLAKAGWDKDLSDNNSFYAAQADSINKNYDAQVNKENKAYEDSYRENAIQKLINERQVAENMANLGLTNSGLNRTQQTAVQLSYANNKANIDRQKQSAIEDINLARTQSLDTNEQNRMKSESAINQGYEESITKTAQENYKNYFDYLSEQEETNSKLYEYAYDKKNDYGEVEYRVFHLDGKEVKVKDGCNPYTRENNKDKYAYEAKNYGFFSNGYQPKGVKGHGAFVGAIGTDNLYGKNQSVWEAEDGTLWYWNGRTNEYEVYVLEVR